MRRRLSSIGVLATCLVVISTLTMFTGTATGAPGNQRVAPIRFLHRTQPSAARAQAASSADTGLAAELADGPNVKRVLREEQEPGGGEGTEPASAPAASSVPIGSGKPTKSFEGLNHFHSRYSGGGNQFSGEPPDQALCAGNGRLFEMVNSVVQVYTPSGTALIEGTPAFPGTGPVGLTLNEFYGVPPSIVRPDGPPFGPFMFDISCLFDPEGQRWFAVSDELDLDPPTGAFSGPSAVFVAVSTTANPLGAWNVYVIDTTNNGENGTPDHGCSSGFCFADYPQIGLDANGFYISTNEFDNLLEGEFHGAQLYAFSKADLEAGDSSPTSVYFENVTSDAVNDVAYTLQPANGLAADWDSRARGTMYFGMSHSPFTEPDPADGLSLWALRNTRSLDGTPALTLAETEVATQDYLVPPKSRQLGGKTPFLRCVNMGVDCIGIDYPFIKSPLPLDSGSGKFYGSWLHDGTVYLTTATELKGTGAANYDSTDGSWTPINRRVGVAYFGVSPSPGGGGFSASLEQQGYVAVARNNLIYPSIAIGASGRGAIGVTLSGIDYNPSAAYIPFVAGQAPTSVQIGGLAVGPNDGFTGTGEGGFRPRWGDYGTATISESGSLWIAAEYIAQRCGFQEFVNDTTCGFRRTFYANWSTRVFRLPT